MVTDFPKTVYGLLAKKHGTTPEFVGRVATGYRKALRGKGVKVKEDLQKIEDCFDDWITEFRADKTMIVKMEEIGVEVYVKDGFAKTYQSGQFIDETEIGDLPLSAFKDFLNRIRGVFN